LSEQRYGWSKPRGWEGHEREKEANRKKARRERQNGTSEFENHNVQKFTAKTSLREFAQKLLIKAC
jgi:hypothetical protein